MRGAAGPLTSRKPLVALMTAQAMSIAGTRFSTVAIPWYVLTTTNDPVLAGMVALVEMLPLVIARALGGPLIDRLGARTVSLLCDPVSIVVVALIPLLGSWNLLSLPALFAIVGVLGALRGPSDQAKYSLTPDVAAAAGMPLERATGIGGAVERLGSVAGAAVAGTLVVLFGAPMTLAFTAAALAVAVGCMAFGIPATPRPPRSQHPQAFRGYRDDLAAGWRFLSNDPVLVGITMMLAVTNLLDQAYVSVLVPVWAQHSGYGAQGVGVVLAVFAGFSFIGSATAAALADKLPRLMVFGVAFFLMGLPRFLALGLNLPTVTLFSVLAISGLASGFLSPVLGAVLFERTPADLRGRVTSLNAALCWSGIPFGGIVGGAMVATIGLTPALLVAGVTYAGATMLAFGRRRFRDFAAGAPLTDAEPVPPLSDV